MFQNVLEMNDYDYVRELEVDCMSEKQEMVIGGNYQEVI